MYEDYKVYRTDRQHQRWIGGNDACRVKTQKKSHAVAGTLLSTTRAHRPWPWTAVCRANTALCAASSYFPVCQLARLRQLRLRNIPTGELDTTSDRRSWRLEIRIKKTTVHVATSAMEAIGHKLFQLGDPEGKGFIVRRDMQVRIYM